MLPAAAIDTLVEHVVEACEAAEVEVVSLGIAPAPLADADAVVWEGDPCGRHPTLRARLLRDSVVVATLTVRPDVQGHRLAPVAATDLAPGQPLAWVRGPVPLNVVVDGDPSGIARRALPAGTALTADTWRAAPDQVAGAAVTVVVTRGALQLSVPGTLLADASVGEAVRVRNDANHAALGGVLVAPDRVEIR